MHQTVIGVNPISRLPGSRLCNCSGENGEGRQLHFFSRKLRGLPFSCYTKKIKQHPFPLLKDTLQVTWKTYPTKRFKRFGFSSTFDLRFLGSGGFLCWERRLAAKPWSFSHQHSLGLAFFYPWMPSWVIFLEIISLDVNKPIFKQLSTSTPTWRTCCQAIWVPRNNAVHIWKYVWIIMIYLSMREWIIYVYIINLLYIYICICLKSTNTKRESHIYKHLAKEHMNTSNVVLTFNQPRLPYWVNDVWRGLIVFTPTNSSSPPMFQPCPRRGAHYPHLWPG